jgi:DNA adenine methylase
MYLDDCWEDLNDKYIIELDGGALQPIFGRQGNKFYLRDVIVPLIPPHKIYVELFAGSGAIFFNKEKAEKNILNDLDKTTYNNFLLLKQAPTDISKYRLQEKVSIPKLRKIYDSLGNSITDRFIKAKIGVSSGFNSKPVTKSKEILRSEFNLNNVVTRKLPPIQEKLKGVEILNRDYEEVVKKYDSKDTFFFLDPPYEDTPNSFGYAEDVGFDFERLADVLDGIKGKFLMTINDSKNIRNIFKNFYIKPHIVYTSWGHSKTSRSGTNRKELLVSNYRL